MCVSVLVDCGGSTVCVAARAGLDECTSAVHREKILKWATLPHHNSSMRVVVSSRPSGLPLTRFFGAGFRVLEVQVSVTSLMALLMTSLRPRGACKSRGYAHPSHA